MKTDRAILMIEKDNQAINTLPFRLLDSAPEFTADIVINHIQNISVNELHQIFDRVNTQVNNMNIDMISFMNELKPQLFHKNICFFEWIYIISLNDNRLEIYNGKTHEKKEGKPYYSLVLVKTFNFDDIPEDWLKQVTQNQYL